ncbi:sodium hydrogen exchanger : Sodium/hydrogen exchanger OS=Chthoniobacter flavus Ellin428 GN=CfE428DRAFT_4849 PE=4 SV=1 [Gemmataceae bacterium]|nr:sodium hydrogen exchanger : Sodium/hydrogen exchanger OS=Chthoniobacter flavus Ellin428 GN=CfE428DRAFT_4849 PE=4 SV=1 [Gemmataceae bacterium]VTU01252.1 sodium hydrogen exchanger : Sodium/hydrogen exchanger OS=Chthoniobacter flavus Ellin428 GN=CfE428DRAFT_4849 PE=4 SV=1 [Gemmataceae bacterium]
MVIATAAELAGAIKLEGIAVKRALRGKFAVEQLEVLAKAPSTPSFFLATGFLTDLPRLGRTVTSKRELMFRLLFDLCAVVNKLPRRCYRGTNSRSSRGPGPATPSRPDRPAGAATSGDG